MAAAMLSVVLGDRPSRRRVFLSHTAELRRFPKDYSFVAAAESAVTRARDATTNMAYFTARDARPSRVCRVAVRECDMFVLIAEFLAVVGARDRARVVLEDTLARRIQVLGDDHPDTLAIERRLGDLG